MTATDDLRRLLDERGVERSATVGAKGTIWTHWDAFNGQRIHAMDNEDGTVEIFDQWNLTPAQAIAATLGAWTCQVDATIKWDWDRCEPYWEHELSCGHTVTTMEPEPPHYCSDCGRKVVDE